MSKFTKQVLLAVTIGALTGVIVALALTQALTR